mmetsp:Transcript_17154/g.37033  ORF Transcript_17154/g.37033 Transcript_17154/m.37033 type:complete len:503 (-) Transcript_17154:1029-2537(-)
MSRIVVRLFLQANLDAQVLEVTAKGMAALERRTQRLAQRLREQIDVSPVPAPTLAARIGAHAEVSVTPFLDDHEELGHRNFQISSDKCDGFILDLDKPTTKLGNAAHSLARLTIRGGGVVEPASTVTAAARPHDHLLLPRCLSGELHAHEDSFEVVLIARGEMRSLKVRAVSIRHAEAISIINHLAQVVSNVQDVVRHHRCQLFNHDALVGSLEVASPVVALARDGVVGEYPIAALILTHLQPVGHPPIPHLGVRVIVQLSSVGPHRAGPEVFIFEADALGSPERLGVPVVHRLVIATRGATRVLDAFPGLDHVVWRVEAVPRQEVVVGDRLDLLVCVGPGVEVPGLWIGRCVGVLAETGPGGNGVPVEIGEVIRVDLFGVLALFVRGTHVDPVFLVVGEGLDDQVDAVGLERELEPESFREVDKANVDQIVSGINDGTLVQRDGARSSGVVLPVDHDPGGLGGRTHSHAGDGDDAGLCESDASLSAWMGRIGRGRRRLNRR